MTQPKDRHGASIQALTEEEFEALRKRARKKESARSHRGADAPDTSRLPAPDLTETVVSIYTVARDGMLQSRIDGNVELPSGSKVKLLSEADLDKYQGSEWIYSVVDIWVQLGSTAAELKKGSQVAVLPKDYKQKLEEHASQED